MVPGPGVGPAATPPQQRHPRDGDHRQPAGRHDHRPAPAASAPASGRAAAAGGGDWATLACTCAVAVLWYGAGALTVTRQSPGESNGPLL